MKRFFITVQLLALTWNSIFPIIKRNLIGKDTLAGNGNSSCKEKARMIQRLSLLQDRGFFPGPLIQQHPHAYTHHHKTTFLPPIYSQRFNQDFITPSCTVWTPSFLALHKPSIIRSLTSFSFWVCDSDLFSHGWMLDSNGHIPHSIILHELSCGICCYCFKVELCWNIHHKFVRKFLSRETEICSCWMMQSWRIWGNYAD